MDFGLLYKRLNFLFNYFGNSLKKGFDDNSYFNKNNYLKKYPDVKNSGMGAFKHYLTHGINENRNDIYNINVESFSLVQDSGLFNQEFYSKESGLKFETYNQALFHYLECGYKNGFNPSSRFNAKIYVKKYPDVLMKGFNPLVHYLKYGRNEDKTDACDKNLKEYELVKNSGLFDFEFYKNESKMNFSSERLALLHYLEIGYKKGFDPNSSFSGKSYLKIYFDVKMNDWNPLVHYLKFGKKENRMAINFDFDDYNLVKYSGLFDLDYYENESNIKFRSEIEGLIHYLEYGYKNGFNPSSRFNAIIYVKKYPNVLRKGFNPLVHYLKYGRNEDKTDVCNKNLKEYELVKNSGLFDFEFYKNESKMNFSSERLALLHYLEFGYKKGFNPNNSFNNDSYLKFNEDVKNHDWNPLVHYLKFGKKENRLGDNIDFDDYNLVKYSGLFDLDYYENESKMKFQSEEDGIIHYLTIGFKNGFNPNPKFDGIDYYEKYNDVARIGMNPLIHYLKFGKLENRDGIKKFVYDNFNESFDVKQILSKISNNVTIIMPIFNLVNSKKAVRNLYVNSKNFDLVLLDTLNLSEDDLNYFKFFKNLNIINNIDSQSKLINSINTIIMESSNDVILIKENVLPFKNWILKLVIAAYSDDTIGFVTPISNFSTIKLIDLPKNIYSPTIINKISKKKYFEAPISNDACVYIKREVFNELKFDNNLDESSWMYDFTELAQMKGWKSVVDDSTYVYWDKGQFKNTQKDKYDLSVPYYYQNNPNKYFIKSEVFSKIYDNIHKYSKEDFNRFTKKTVLFSMHNGGGVENTVKDIIKSISDKFDSYLLKAFKNRLILYKYYNGEFIISEEFKLKYDWNSQIIYSDEYEQIYFYILINYNIDIVQIDHSIFHTFDLPAIAKLLDIPLIITLHDFYYICPTYFLLDGENNYCAGNCGDKSRNCSTRVSWFDLPVNIVEWKHKWNEYVEELFDYCDIIVTANSFTKNMFLNYYSKLPNGKITLIEHGCDLIRFNNIHRVPNKYQKIRLLIPGIIGPHKGSHFIKQLKSYDIEDKLELHYIGVVDDELKSIGIYHGRYDREDFAKMVYKIKPSFIGIFSVCAETFSYTLTESISTGVPVIASNLGALKNRIESNGGGWLIDINDPKGTYDKILNLANDKDEYNSVQNKMIDIKISNISEMGNNYKKLYGKLINDKI